MPPPLLCQRAACLSRPPLEAARRGGGGGRGDDGMLLALTQDQRSGTRVPRAAPLSPLHPRAPHDVPGPTPGAPEPLVCVAPAAATASAGLEAPVAHQTRGAGAGARRGGDAGAGKGVRGAGAPQRWLAPRHQNAVAQILVGSRCAPGASLPALAQPNAIGNLAGILQHLCRSISGTPCPHLVC